MAEIAIKSLVKTEILDRNFFVKSEDQTLMLPLIRNPTRFEIDELRKLVPDASSGTEDFEPRTRHPRTLDEALAERISPSLLSSLPRSFDVVGDITVLQLDSDLAAYETSIAEAIMEVHPNVRAVFAKSGDVSGTERIRPLRHIAGENRTKTIHIEHGCFFRVDLSKVFFSPRLSTEHQRIAQKVDNGERVVDMFAGVGPFSILIAKTVADIRVEAIDANPQAVELLRENVRANKVESKVHAHLGDSRDIIRENFTHVASRVIMNHPSASKDFIKEACDALHPTGGLIHYYTFASSNWEADSRNELERGVEESGYIAERVLGIHRVREVAPMKWQVAVDLRVVPRPRSRNFDGHPTGRVLKQSDHVARDVNRGFVRMDHKSSIRNKAAFSDDQVRLVRKGQSRVSPALHREFEQPNLKSESTPPARTRENSLQI